MPTLAAGTYGALKAYVEAQGLNISLYKDAAPPTTKDPVTGLLKKPYCTIIEDLSMTSDSRDDGGAGAGGSTYVSELVQLDLWMNWRDSADKSLEDRALPSAIHRKLDGCTLDLSPTRVYNVVVQNRIRLVERDNNVVHVAYTLAIRRAL